MISRAQSLRMAALHLLAALAVLLVCSLSGCSERAGNALAYGAAALLGAFALLLVVVCLSGFELRRGPR